MSCTIKKSTLQQGDVFTVAATTTDVFMCVLDGAQLEIVQLDNNGAKILTSLGLNMSPVCGHENVTLLGNVKDFNYGSS